MNTASSERHTLARFPARFKAAWRLLLVICSVFCSSVHAFQLTNLSQERVHLADHIGDGRWTLVMLWSTDCIPCEEQKPMIEAFHRDHVSRDAHVVGVALDGLEKRELIQELIERHAPTYPNLVVFTDVFHRQFRELTGKEFRATPTYLLFAPGGELAGTRSGRVERALLESVVSGG